MSRALKNGLDALLFLATRTSVGVTELAQVLGVDKSTASRILVTLQEADMVEKNPETLKYSLGPVILQLSERYHRNLRVMSIARPIMGRLVAEVRESAHLCVLANGRAVIVEQVLSDSRFTVNVNARVGGFEPLHCSSVGKCLLALAPDESRQRMLKNAVLDAYTSSTITDMDRLNAELAKIESAGYAVDEEELSPGIKCVAVPIRNRRGECEYSLGVSGMTARMTDDKLNRMLRLMLRAAEDIHSRL